MQVLYVIVKVHEIFSETVDGMQSFGYNYCVDSTISPVSQETKRVMAQFHQMERDKNLKNLSVVFIEPMWSTDKKRVLNMLNQKISDSL